MGIKKMLALLIVLSFFYIGFSVFFKRDRFSYEVNYEVKNEGKIFKIKEILTYHEKEERDNYYLEIDTNGHLFTMHVFEVKKNAKYQIQDIAHYEDQEYYCIAPLLKGKNTPVEILCQRENITYSYHTIKGQNKDIDAFAASLNYEDSAYIDDKRDVLKKGTVSLYRKNIVKNHFLALESYKGIILVNESDIYKNIELFSSDIYTKNMSIFAKDIYISADYNQKYNFNEFFLINIKTGKKETLISHSALNLDGYAMGFVDDKAYFFDKQTQEQYFLDSKKKKMTKLGNKEKGIQIYENGVWIEKSSLEAYQNKLIFYEEKISEGFATFDRVDKVGTKKAGYYYLYKKDKDKYQVYRSPICNPTNYTYLFATTNIENIVYQGDFVYFIHGSEIQYYSDTTGVRTVLSNTEFKYNKSLKFGLFLS